MVTARALGPHYMKLLATPIEYWANESLFFFINVKIGKNVSRMISLAAKSGYLLVSSELPKAMLKM